MCFFAEQLPTLVRLHLYYATPATVLPGVTLKYARSPGNATPYYPFLPPKRQAANEYVISHI